MERLGRIDLKSEQVNTSNGLLVVIAGPPGSGKDMTRDGIVTRMKNLGLTNVVTCATRPQRPNEVHGVDYWFLSEAEFNEMEFLEVVDNDGTGRNRKGTSKNSIAEVLKGARVVWRIDPERALSLRSTFMEKFSEEEANELMDRTVVVFVGVPRLTILKDRVARRDGTSPRSREEFIGKLRKDWGDWLQYQENSDELVTVVMNEDGRQEDTLDEVERVILEKAYMLGIGSPSTTREV